MRDNDIDDDWCALVVVVVVVAAAEAIFLSSTSSCSKERKKERKKDTNKENVLLTTSDDVRVVRVCDDVPFLFPKGLEASKDFFVCVCVFHLGFFNCFLFLVLGF